MGSGPFPTRIKDKWGQINGFVFISTRGRCLAQKVSARDRGTCGQVSWIETKGTTDKRGIIGPDPFSILDPFSIFRLFHVEVGGARPVDLRHLTMVMDAIAGYQYPTHQYLSYMSCFLYRKLVIFGKFGMVNRRRKP